MIGNTVIGKGHPENNLEQLYNLVAHLRSKNGCPWDRKQTPASMVKYLLEEAGELARAIEENDPAHICEEIGDMFFILTILSAMYEEQGEFTGNDALKNIIEKMIRRHPHVFADKSTGNEEELRRQWEEIKRQEKETN
jgi:uncharacterized protein YabN with tetrapyrrole methylase and pyrophosphatase domain